MRIQSNDIIAGQPVFAVRKLLKQESGTSATIAESLHIDPIQARQVYQVLSTQGYIEPSSQPFEADESWHTTRKGNALANATARKTITRKTAERLIQEFLQRVREVVNAL